MSDLTSPDMPTILQQIVEQRRGDLAGIAERIRHVDPAALPVSTRSLEHALRAPGATGAYPRGGNRVIMECKSASPSRGLLRGSYDPAAIARVYSRYAAAISVLCEPHHFGGDYDHLAAVASATHLPVLCKDFIIDPVQIHAARWFGADAILLMLSVLTDDQYRELAAEAARLHLDVLTETATVDEMQRATALGARIIGINHRDLHTLTIDLSRTEQLAPLAGTDALIVAESGINDYATLTALGGHVNGFLVGSRLTSQPDIDIAARALVYGSSKVCGLTTPAAAIAARAAGAVYGGLIFVNSSPRYVTDKQASTITDTVDGLRFVAVTRDLDTAVHAATISDRIHAIQIHNPVGTIEEEKALAEKFRQATRNLPGRATPPQLWRALNMSAPHAASIAQQLVDDAVVDMLVLDAGTGGSGVTFDWATIPAGVKSRSLLAGGLNLTNLPQALTVGCAGVDLNSGVEYPNVCGQWAHHKDPGAIRRAFTMIASFTARTSSATLSSRAPE